MPRWTWPLTRVAVEGRSMVPTLWPGEWWLVRRTADAGPGDVVVLERPDRPGLLVVKRVVRADGDGWWVEGDNPDESDDSRRFGPVPREAVVGTLLWRYHPLRRPEPAGGTGGSDTGGSDTEGSDTGRAGR